MVLSASNLLMQRLADRGGRRVTSRAAAFRPGPGSNRPDPIPGSHSTVGLDPSRPLPDAPVGQPNLGQLSQSASQSPNLFSDYWDQYYNSPAETLNPSPFFPRPRPGVPAAPAVAVAGVPPRTPPRVLQALRRRVGQPVRRAPAYLPAGANTSPALQAILGIQQRPNVYGGSGFGGAGGAWTGAMNDAFSASGGYPGVGNTYGPNPGALDPDYGYWD